MTPTESLCTNTPQPTPAPLYQQQRTEAPRCIPPDAAPQAPTILDDEILPQDGPHQHGPWVIGHMGTVCRGCLLPLAVVAQQRKREGRA